MGEEKSDRKNPLRKRTLAYVWENNIKMDSE
jgi:hypothetical protein